MYAVVGCSECRALWIVEGSPDRSACPRCGTTRAHDRRRSFLETEDADHAREVRASMLAARGDHDEAFARLDSFAELGERVDEAGPDDETYLAAAGVDPDAVAAAGERAGSDGTGQSNEAVVRAALRHLDDPEAADVVEYAAERGVPADYVRRALEKLVRAGDATEDRGTYRLL